MSNIKCSIDKEEPKTMDILSCRNNKKNDVKLTEVERENRILLEKITKIM